MIQIELIINGGEHLPDLPKGMLNLEQHFDLNYEQELVLFDHTVKRIGIKIEIVIMNNVQKSMGCEKKIT